MARKCDITGTKTATGNNKKHRRGSSGGGGAWKFKAQKTKRKWRPNLKKVRVFVNGKPKNMKVSMKAYKKLKEQEAKSPNIRIA